MTETTPTPWATREEAAEYLRVSVATIDRWAAEGRITKHSVPGLRSARYRRDELDGVFTPEVRPAGSTVTNPFEVPKDLEIGGVPVLVDGAACCGECGIWKTKEQFEADGGCCSRRAVDHGNRWPGEKYRNRPQTR